MLLPNFIYRIAENRYGKMALYIILFAAIFVFIVIYLQHLESAS